MNTFILSAGLALLLVTAAHAVPRLSASYSVVAEGLDDGGQRTASAAYVNEGSTGGFASIPATGGAGVQATMGGFSGQLYEIVGLAVVAAQTNLNAGETVQLGTWQKLDDGTLLAAPETLAFQWFFNGNPIAGASGPALHVASARPGDAGVYSVRASRPDGTILLVESVTLAVVSPATPRSRIVNLSTRALDLTGENQLIPGFVLAGSGVKRILLRGIGPGLGSFGVSDTLADPQMTLFDGAGAQLASNNDWGAAANKAEIVATAARVGAFPLVDGSKDSALLLDLPPGSYTVPTTGVADGTGVALLEVYDADPGAPTANLVNLSNRGFVGVNDRVMIPGIVVSNEGPRTFLFRAVGPSLAAFGVKGVLADPVLTVFQGTVAIFANDDWGLSDGGVADPASVARQVGAFPLENGSKDSAVVVTLNPGAYTVQAAGKNGTSGVALVEVYLVP